VLSTALFVIARPRPTENVQKEEIQVAGKVYDHASHHHTTGAPLFSADFDTEVGRGELALTSTAARIRKDHFSEPDEKLIPTDVQQHQPTREEQAYYFHTQGAPKMQSDPAIIYTPYEGSTHVAGSVSTVQQRPPMETNVRGGSAYGPSNMAYSYQPRFPQQQQAAVYPLSASRLNAPGLVPNQKIGRNNGSEKCLTKSTKSIKYHSGAVSSHKSFDKLADVVSESSGTGEFAGNLIRFLNDNIPPFVWILFSLLQIGYGLISLFIGTLNYPYCMAAPKIPVYLVLSGLILVVHGSVRICAHVPMPSASRNVSTNRPRRPNKAYGFCMLAIEGAILALIVVVLVFGCVWVYGAPFARYGR